MGLKGYKRHKDNITGDWFADALAENGQVIDKEDVFKHTGFIKMLFDEFMETATKPSRDCALAAALTVASATVGRFVRSSDTPARVFSIITMNTGGGKNHVHSFIKTIVDGYMNKNNDFCKSAELGGSWQGLEDSFLEIGNMVITEDEFSFFMKAINKGDMSAISMQKRLLEWYSPWALTRPYNERDLSKISQKGKKKTYKKRVWLPAWSCCFTSTIDGFQKELGEDWSNSGFLNRFLLFKHNETGELTPYQHTRSIRLSDEMLDYISYWHIKSKNAVRNLCETIVTNEIEEDEAKENKEPKDEAKKEEQAKQNKDILTNLKNKKRESFREESKSMESMLLSNIVNMEIEGLDKLTEMTLKIQKFLIDKKSQDVYFAERLRENAMRLSMLIAVSEDKKAKKVTIEQLKKAFNMACFFVKNSCEICFRQLESHQFKVERKNADKILKALDSIMEKNEKGNVFFGAKGEDTTERHWVTGSAILRATGLDRKARADALSLLEATSEVAYFAEKSKNGKQKLWVSKEEN